MQRLQLTVLFISVAVLCQAAATHHPLHCSKWNSNCQKYDKYCTGESSTVNRVWQSCCEPLNFESSGDSSSDTNSTKSSPSSDIYTIKVSTYSNTLAYCDMTTDGGGWRVIMRRADGVESFERYYDEYEEGFGDLHHDFFYGLRALHDLTSRDRYEARIDLYSKRNDTESAAFGVYNIFEVRNKEHGYSLRLGNFTPSEIKLEDNLEYFNSQPFVAKQRNLIVQHVCVQPKGRGGWWYTNNCRGTHGKGTLLTDDYESISWFDPNVALGKVRYEKYELKIRLKSCSQSDTLSSL